MLKLWPVSLLLLLLPACASDASKASEGEPTPADGAGSSAATDDGEADTAGPGPSEHAWCEGETRQIYDPLSGENLDLFPDDFLTRDDETSPSGLRLDPSSLEAWAGTVTEIIRDAISDLEVLSGFGTHTGVFMRFTAPLALEPPSPEESVLSHTLSLWDLESDPPARVPYELKTNEEGRAFILWPQRPLRPKTLHAVVLSTEHKAEDGGCVAPSTTLRALLAGTASEPALERLLPSYARMLEVSNLAPEEVSAATVFTTHGDLDLLVEVAKDIRTRGASWAGARSCEEDGPIVRCKGAFKGRDYRGETGYIDSAEPKAEWSVPVTVWLPKDGEGPFPVLVAAHGINADVSQMRRVAVEAAKLGLASVATDAVQHGEHPSVMESDTDLAALRFLGIDIEAFRIDALALRGNFNQTTFDRLHLIELVKAHPDVDGDGKPDLDPTRIGTWGISLGGMLGASLLALSGDLQLGLLNVAGGGLLTFATETSRVKPFKPALISLFGSEDVFEQLLAVAQSLVDPADPATFAAHVLANRVVGDSAPDVLLNVALEDDTVPPATGRTLARALGTPHLGPVFHPVAVIPKESELPVSGNVAGGSATAGYFQYDRVSTKSGSEKATHDNVPFSDEALLQERHFLETWLEVGMGEILDPYEELGTPPLE